MGYPRKIFTLVVEDEPEIIDTYRELFRDLGQEFALAPPCFVQSYNDAKLELLKPVPYHLLILDLGLPYETRTHAAPGLDPGLSLIREAVGRDAIPIPAVLVISGRLKDARFPDLMDQLQDFWHGRFIKKGDEEPDAIRAAIKDINRYCDVGIHLACGAFGTYPTISPREEELLRRCVLQQEQCLGLQLSWWSADRMHVSAGQSASDVWTKVLMGRFILDDGMGMSRPTFFKLEPAGNADAVRRAATVMQHKLPHIHVAANSVAGTRSLLVTQKVGEGDNPPISINEYLRRSPEEVSTQIPGIVSAIGRQLTRLGDVQCIQKPVRELLWPYHSFENIAAMFSRHYPGGGNGQLAFDTDPIRLYEILAAESRYEWVHWQTVTHGDLNASNVAIDDEGAVVQAYIFDASGMGAAGSTRDLANLEVTTLLHHALPPPDSLVEFCAPLFLTDIATPENHQIPDGPAMAINVMKTVAEIRRYAFQIEDPVIYALTVFDCALIQLGGLAWGLSGNKIENPSAAALLACYAATWLRRVAPEMCGRDVRPVPEPAPASMMEV